MTQIDRNGLEVLDRADCIRLLRTVSLGRIGITAGALPTILPINFRVDGDRILFRTGVGTKLDAATRGAVVAFEADDIDPMYHSGWSVVVTGIAREVAGSRRPRGVHHTALGARTERAPRGGEHRGDLGSPAGRLRASERVGAP